MDDGYSHTIPYLHTMKNAIPRHGGRPEIPSPRPVLWGFHHRPSVGTWLRPAHGPPGAARAGPRSLLVRRKSSVEKMDPEERPGVNGGSGSGEGGVSAWGSASEAFGTCVHHAWIKIKTRESMDLQSIYI